MMWQLLYEQDILYETILHPGSTSIFTSLVGKHSYIMGEGTNIFSQENMYYYIYKSNSSDKWLNTIWSSTSSGLGDHLSAHGPWWLRLYSVFFSYVHFQTSWSFPCKLTNLLFIFSASLFLLSFSKYFPWFLPLFLIWLVFTLLIITVIEIFHFHPFLEIFKYHILYNWLVD